MIFIPLKLPNSFSIPALQLFICMWLELCARFVPVYSRYPISISCFSCASEEYEPLYSRSENVYTFGQPMQFDKACDSQIDLENFSPTIRCDSSCITVLEPQFFGGILNEKKPYTFVRGCATDIFAVATAAANEPEERTGVGSRAAAVSSRADYETGRTLGVGRMPPAEIDFLHKADMCLSLPIQELWPELFTNSGGTKNTELVKVCACTSHACNSHDALSSAAAGWRKTRSYGNQLIFLLIRNAGVECAAILVPIVLLRWW